MAASVASLLPLLSFARDKAPEIPSIVSQRAVQVCKGLSLSIDRPDAYTTDSLRSFIPRLETLIAYPFALVIVYAFLSVVKQKQFSSTSKDPSHSLDALQTILAPTQSRWPYPYRTFDKLTSSKQAVINLSLSTLIHDIVSGAVELRNPKHDLPHLVRGGILVQGFRIRLQIDFAFQWRMAYSALLFRYASTGRQLHDLSVQLLARIGDDLDQGPRFLPRSHPTPHETFLVDLDFVPSSKLEVFFYHLRKTLPDGARLTFLFTTVEPSSFLSYRSYAVVSLSYLPGSSRLSSSARTPFALSTSLPQVLDLLEAVFLVDGAENISQTYSSALCEAADLLRNNPKARSTFVRQHDMEGWREECFRGLWEAALIKAGRLTKWKIMVRKRQGPELEGDSVCDG